MQVRTLGSQALDSGQMEPSRSDERRLPTGYQPPFIGLEPSRGEAEYQTRRGGT
jgi:hypothetical protein